MANSRTSKDLLNLNNTQPRLNLSSLHNLSASRDFATNPFNNSGLLQTSKNGNKHKKLFHFSHRNGNVVPRMALNHASVFLDTRTREFSEFDPTDDVPDENIDHGSRSLVNNTIVSRGSITNRLNMSSSFDSPFSNSFNRISQRPNMEQMYRSVSNFATVKFGEAVPGSPKTASIYQSYKTANVSRHAAPSVPTTEVLMKNLEFQRETRTRVTKFDTYTTFQNLDQIVTKTATKHKKNFIKQLKNIAVEYKVRKVYQKKRDRKRRPIRRKAFAAVLLIQRALRIRKARKGLKRALIPSLEMMGLSPFLNFKNYIKAYMLGWKTRKIMQCHNIENYRRNVEELIQFYGEGSEKNKYVLKAKQDYIEAVRRALKNPNWWKDLVSSKAIQDKMERVQKMREKNKRLRETKVGVIGNTRSYNYGGDYSTKHQNSNASDGGGMSMAFDFSKTCKQKKKSYEEEQEEKRKQKIEENRQKKKTNFLKRRANLKYDPMKAIEDDNVKREAMTVQTDEPVENYEEIEDDETEGGPKISAAAIKLSDLIEKEKQRKMNSKRPTVKEILASPKPQIQKTKSNVSDNFQKLDYLKKIPKRVDCWLSNERKQSTIILPTSGNEQELSRTMKKRNSTQSLLEKSPSSNIGNPRQIEDFEDFSKTVGLKKKLKKEPLETQKSMVNLSRDYNQMNRLNDSGISAESFNLLSMNKSQLLLKPGFDHSSPKAHISPRMFKESLFSNEGECLEFLLERLEGGNNYKGLMSSTDKLALREDKSMYAKLTTSKPLLEIFRLMNNVEKINNNPKTEASKTNYDFEFEKLLLKLKEEYNAMFKQKENDKILLSDR